MSILSSLRWYSVRYHLKEWGSLALLVAVIVGPLTLFGWLFFSTDTFTVQSITVVDARPHTTEALQNLARKTLGHNILFVNTARLEREALQAFPQIRDIYIARTLPGTLKLVVQEKEPALLLLSGGTYYVLDEQGIVYEEARFDTLPGTVLPIVKNTGE
ncbi:MAG: cell division protein FtsQ/DivIB, partial [Acidobacteriota bacterium]